MSDACSEGIEGVRERHCFHDHGDGYVCCWCGDLFVRDDETSEHGEYRPEQHTEGRRLERAAIVADLRARALAGGFSSFTKLADRYERGEHVGGVTHRRPDGRACDYLGAGSICTKCGTFLPEAT